MVEEVYRGYVGAVHVPGAITNFILGSMRGTLNSTFVALKYNNPYYRDPQTGTPEFGKPRNPKPCITLSNTM